MFDRTYVDRSEAKVIAVTKEIEKAISPDKVTEMYDKVRAQAEKDVIASLRVESNLLNGVVIQIADQFSMATSRIHARFILNGNEYTDMNTINSREVLNSGEMYQKLTNHYLYVLRNVLLRDIVSMFSKAFHLAK